MEKKTLIIVDPQYDFISGSLGVAGAKKQLELLEEHISTRREDYSGVIITLDAHPINHCSFSSEGGQWPKHCVKYTNGFLPNQELMETIFRLFPVEEILIIEKGEDKDIEEYSAMHKFENARQILDFLENRKGSIDVTGIMSEYCVKETVKGLVEDGGEEIKSRLRVILPYIATLDNHAQLKEYCQKEEIEVLETLESI